jgi:hypothetical protein
MGSRSSGLGKIRIPMKGGLLLPKPGMDVRIDINGTNQINPSSRGIIPVAILGSGTFDVDNVDVMTLAFGPSGAGTVAKTGIHLEDVNDDDLTDLVARYSVPGRSPCGGLGVPLVVPAAATEFPSFR